MHTPEGGDRRNWPEELVNKCHKNYDGHTDTYGRMSWDKPAPTLTTKCNSYSMVVLGILTPLNIEQLA